METLQQAWGIALGVIVWLWENLGPYIIALGKLLFGFIYEKIGELIQTLSV